MSKFLSVLIVCPLLLACVGSKKYKTLQGDYATLNNKYTQLQADLKSCEDDKLRANSGLQAMQSANDYQKQQISSLKEQVEYLKTNTNQMISNLKDLSVISEKQAESVGKSLDKLSERDAYIKDLQGALARKDSLNMNLVLNLKGALRDVNDEDIQVQVEKGVVFISISDKLLFATGKYNINPGAKNVLGKVATVLKSQPNLEFLVEGHTDNVPITGTGIPRDNWDLGALRATAVVRSLQNDYGVDPTRMTAGSRSEYIPVQSNATAEGRSANRRTRIVVLPQLDQFFQLLEANTTAAPAAR